MHIDQLFEHRYSQEGSMIGTYCAREGMVIQVDESGPVFRPKNGVGLYLFNNKGLLNEISVAGRQLHYLGAYTLEELKTHEVKPDHRKPLQLGLYAVFALDSPRGQRVTTDSICTYVHVFSR